MIFKITFLVLLLSLQSCIVYEPNVYQGNEFKSTQANLLKNGATVGQADYILGTSILSNIINNREVDYVNYTYYPANKATKTQNFTLTYNTNGIIEKTSQKNN